MFTNYLIVTILFLTNNLLTNNFLPVNNLLTNNFLPATWMKIVEFAGYAGYLQRHLPLIGLTLFVIVVLLLLRKRIGRRLTTVGSLAAVAGLGCYLGLAYVSISRTFHNTVPAYDIQGFVEEQPIGPEDFVSDFKEIDQCVKKWYELEAHKGISLDELSRTYGRQVAQARDKREYFGVLRRYFSELKNNRTALCYQTYKAPAHAEWRGDSLYVRVSYLKNPMQSGDRILEINGKDVVAWRDSMMQYVSASTDWIRRTATANLVFDSYTDTVRSYTMMRGDSLYAVSLPLYRDLRKQLERLSQSERNTHRMVPYSSSRLRGVDPSGEAAPYWLWPRFVGSEVAELEKLSSSFKAEPRMVIDVANTAGGQLESVLEMARYFLKKPYVTVGGDTLCPHPQAYQGQLYVFVSRYTTLEAELFASILQESGSATLFGEETSGDFGGPVKTFCTSRGTLFTVGAGKPQRTAAGRNTEGEGLQPDLCVGKNHPVALLKRVRSYGFKLVKE